MLDGCRENRIFTVDEVSKRRDRLEQQLACAYPEDASRESRSLPTQQFSRAAFARNCKKETGKSLPEYRIG